MEKLLAKLSYYWMIGSFVGGLLFRCLWTGCKIEFQVFKEKLLLLKAIKEKLSEKKND